MIHEGFHKNRLEQNNPREVVFSEVWKRKNHEGVLGLSTTVEILIPDCTERDAKVAATIIQWLGSNVGMSFLYEVLRKSQETREWFGLSQIATDLLGGLHE